MLERLAQNNANKVRILKVDVTEHNEWAAQQKVRGIPTFQIYSGGSLVEQFAGAYPENFLQQKIDKYAINQGGAEAGENSEVQSAAPKPIQPMPKDWLPPGVTPSK